MKFKAFTLIELLIVVAIIAILAAIAVPNFLEAQTRSKVSRVRSDLRTVTLGLESYQADNSKYPSVSWLPGYSLPCSNSRVGSKDYGMTTPIAYISSMPIDPFGNEKMSNDAYMAFNTTPNYWYWTQDYVDQQTWGGTGAWNRSGPGSVTPCKWAMMSKGPDKVWSHTGAPQGTEEVDKPQKWAYDPTNGTISWGNITRVGP
ncbi:MAG: prepilin-type N-terminal cleavage/methylation domain-containing protein [bacterium]